MTDLRLTCIVPGCNHTRGRRKGERTIQDGEEWICGDHWRLVPAYMRRRKARFARLYRVRFGDNPYWAYVAGSDDRLKAVRLARLKVKAWLQCRRAAIERALGI